MLCKTTTLQGNGHQWLVRVNLKWCINFLLACFCVHLCTTLCGCIRCETAGKDNKTILIHMSIFLSQFEMKIAPSCALVILLAWMSNANAMQAVSPVLSTTAVFSLAEDGYKVCGWCVCHVGVSIIQPINLVVLLTAVKVVVGASTSLTKSESRRSALYRDPI